MPELPEVEAWVRELAPLVSASPVLQAGPAHIATLKTFDPPLRELEGRRLEGAHRRGKWLLFPTDDGELQLRIHLMSAGRIRHLASGAKGPKTPAFRLRFEDGGELVLTEAGPKKRAGVWLESPEQTEAELAHIGPEALGLGVERLREILAGDNRRLHSLLRDQRALAGIGRAHANEILNRAQLSPFALSSKLSDEEIERLAAAIDEDLASRARAARAREGRQGRLPRPPAAGRALPALRRPAPAGRLRGAHGLLLRALPDRRPSAEGPEDVAPAAVGSSDARRSLGLLAVALVLSMSTWFSASAVLPQLRAEWELGTTAGAWLTIAVQLGFVAGALFSSLVNLADVHSARLVIVGGSLGAAAANLCLLAASGASDRDPAPLPDGRLPRRRLPTGAEADVDLVRPRPRHRARRSSSAR